MNGSPKPDGVVVLRSARFRPGVPNIARGTVVSRIGYDDPYTVIGHKNEGNGRGFTVKVRDEAGGIHHFRAWLLEPWGAPVAVATPSALDPVEVKAQATRQVVDFDFEVGDLVVAAGTRVRFHVAERSDGGAIVKARSLNGGIHYFLPDLLERVPVQVGDCEVEI